MIDRTFIAEIEKRDTGWIYVTPESVHDFGHAECSALLFQWNSVANKESIHEDSGIENND